MFINCTLQQAITRVQNGATVWIEESGEGLALCEPESWSKRAIRTWLAKVVQRAKDWDTNGEEPHILVQ